MTPEIKEAIIKLKRTIQNNSWTQKSYARDCKGNSISPASSVAESFCLIGAVHKTFPYEENLNLRVDINMALREKLIKIYPELYYSDKDSIVKYNDDIAKSKEDVIKLLDSIIEEKDPNA